MTMLKQPGATALRLTDLSLMPHICAIADSINTYLKLEEMTTRQTLKACYRLPTAAPSLKAAKPVIFMYVKP